MEELNIFVEITLILNGPYQRNFIEFENFKRKRRKGDLYKAGCGFLPHICIFFYIFVPSPHTHICMFVFLCMFMHTVLVAHACR